MKFNKEGYLFAGIVEQDIAEQCIRSEFGRVCSKNLKQLSYFIKFVGFQGLIIWCLTVVRKQGNNQV